MLVKPCSIVSASNGRGLRLTFAPLHFLLPAGAVAVVKFKAIRGVPTAHPVEG